MLLEASAQNRLGIDIAASGAQATFCKRQILKIALKSVNVEASKSHRVSLHFED
jgi:hypothetical protein